LEVPRKCRSCGAAPARLDAHFCDSCGAELPLLEPPGTSAPDPLADADARLRALEKHPDLPALLGRERKGSSPALEVTLAVVLLLVLVTLGLFAATLVFTFCPPLGVLPLIAVGIAGYVLVQRTIQAVRLARIPTESRPALVASVRSRIHAGAADRRDSAVTLLFPGGERREAEAPADVASTLAAGALGVAYLKGDVLSGFARVSV